jgi:hypothetical protein
LPTVRRERLRALNVPTPVAVALDTRGLPVSVDERAVETVLEIWRIDDEWWRETISRRCYEVVLVGGGRLIVFEDLVTGEWRAQKP